MGTGKSAVGAELCKMTGYKLVDVDSEVERVEGMSIKEIFETRGEPAFREAEAREIGRILERRSQVVSTGGGAVLRDDNMAALSGGGVVVCLRAPAETIYERTRRNRNRPLLDVEDPLGKIREMLEERRPFYEKADIMIDTGDKSPYEIAQEVLETLRWKR